VSTREGGGGGLAEALLAWWLGEAARDPSAVEARLGFWFEADPAVDAEVRRRFAKPAARAAEGALDAWAEAPRSALARVLLLDQVPRNVHRGRPEAFAAGARALAATRDARARGFEEALSPVEGAFLLLPYQHAEDLAAQEEGVEAYEALAARAAPAWRAPVETFARFAREHRDVLQRFGRFPHRNALLGRAATEGERAFLEGGGATYGQSAADPGREETEAEGG